jgi:hypothetical protein
MVFFNGWLLYACFCIPCNNSCFTTTTINVLVAYWPDLSSHASIYFLPCSDFLKCWISPLCLWSSDFQHSLLNITQLTWEIFSIRLTMFDEVLHTTLVKYNIHFKWLKNCIWWIKIILWNMSGNILVEFSEYLAFATSWWGWQWFGVSVGVILPRK